MKPETLQKYKWKPNAAEQAGALQPPVFRDTEIMITICLAVAPSPVHNFSFSFLGRGIFPCLQVGADSNWPLLPGCCFRFNNTAPNKWPRVAIHSFLHTGSSVGCVISRKTILQIAQKEGQCHPNKYNRLLASC